MIDHHDELLWRQDVKDFPPEKLGEILQEAATYYARLELHRQVRELTPNWHPRLVAYWLNGDPPLDITKLASKPPWCAIAMQFVTDEACAQFGVPNPLDEVKLEAYVPDYVSWAKKNERLLVPASSSPMVGDLIAFSFGGKRYDHLAIIVQPGTGSKVITIEGNTGDVNQREGDGWYMKTRPTDKFAARYIRWAA